MTKHDLITTDFNKYVSSILKAKRPRNQKEYDNIVAESCEQYAKERGYENVRKGERNFIFYENEACLKIDTHKDPQIHPIHLPIGKELFKLMGDNVFFD